jgi:hypothetical protein
MTASKIYLYSDGKVESESVKKLLDESKISYTNLLYSDDNQHPEVFAPLRSWWSEGVFVVEKFPFVIYDDVDDKRQFIAGLQDIKKNISLLG